MTVRPMSNLARGLDVLFAVADWEASPGPTVTRLAVRLGRDRGQISRALHALEQAGLVERASSGAYGLSWELYADASRATDQRLRSTAAGELERLVRASGESAYVTVLRGSQSITLVEHPAPRAVQIASWVGRPFPVYCSDAGRALLFDASTEEIEAVLADTELVRLTPGTPTSVDDFHGRLIASRPFGYTVMDEEAEPGVMAVAAPIRDFRGEVVAAVNVTGARVGLASRIHAVAQDVLRSAATLSRSVGFHPLAEPAASKGGTTFGPGRVGPSAEV
jgi:IclR family pca regulon transcriptional regulator